ncbi:MAG: SDR family NAD(P)-dependent oxidoreductase [Bacteroidales bacterium]|nr:SDR family NAD(P)-dependent oxidoreductase [Bacteroidales bacterium]
MKLTGNNVLITGGSSGIGLELAKRLTENQNKVIICGRSEQKLIVAKSKIPGLITYPCDLSDKKQTGDFVEWLKSNHNDLNVLINNAAIVNRTNFMEDPKAIEKSEQEFKTNVLAPIRLIKLLQPLISTNKNAAIINVTTGLVYIPRAIYPFYNATKAALHSFTQVLRFQLAGKVPEVIEVMFPAVDTPWHQGKPPKIAIPVDKAVNEMLKELAKGKTVIRIGGVKKLYVLSRLIPGFAIKKINSLE